MSISVEVWNRGLVRPGASARIEGNAMSIDTAYICHDCGEWFTTRALADAHISETLAAAKTFGATARSHTIVTDRDAGIYTPIADIAAMFDNIQTLN